MPQASQQTIDEWPHGNQKALELLEANFKELAGCFYAKTANYTPTDEECKAIQYLIEEWDYGYIGAQ